MCVPCTVWMPKRGTNFPTRLPTFPGIRSCSWYVGPNLWLATSSGGTKRRVRAGGHPTRLNNIVRPSCALPPARHCLPQMEDVYHMLPKNAPTTEVLSSLPLLWSRGCVAGVSSDRLAVVNTYNSSSAATIEQLHKSSGKCLLETIIISHSYFDESHCVLRLHSSLCDPIMEHLLWSVHDLLRTSHACYIL